MVVIRLKRLGGKKRPHHRVVVTERAWKQSGRVIETLGHYDPCAEPPRLSLNESRFVYWVSSGAQVSQAVRRLVKGLKRVSLPSS